MAFKEFPPVQLKTLGDIIKFIQENPEYKEFLDKPITMHISEEFLDKRDNWDNEPTVRFSKDHDELIFETWRI